MKNTIFAGLCFSVLTIGSMAQAHDPSKHAADNTAESKAPDCSGFQSMEGMEGMDMPAMDTSDPVYQAMLEQCTDAGAAPMGREPEPHSDDQDDDGHGGHH